MKTIDELIDVMNSLTGILNALQKYGSGFTEDSTAIEAVFAAVKTTANAIKKNVEDSNG